MRPNYFSAIRLPANNVLREKIALRLTRPMGYVRKQGKTLLRGLLVPGYSLDGLPVVDSLSVFSFAPRFVCQEVRNDTVTQACGAGAEIGISGNSEDGLTTYDARITADRIGNRTGTSFQLGFERRF